MSFSRNAWTVVCALPVLSVSVLLACGASRPPSAEPTIKVTGLVVKGAVANANVAAYRVDASLTRGAALGSTTTDADGTFTLTVPAYSGYIELVATGGIYTDESVGTPVQLTSELSTLVSGTPSGAQTSVSATLSPVSTIARHLARSQVRRLGSSPDDAVSTAWTHVNAHFGALAWQNIVPTNVSPTNPVTVTLSDQTKAGLILAGFSQLARSLAEVSSLTPGTVVTAATLISSLASDAADGVLDGSANATALTQGTQPVTAQTLRNGLALAIVHFVNSSHNKTQLAGGDVFSLANAISSNADPYLFSSAGYPLAFTAPGITFVDPPTFVSSTVVSLNVTATQADVGVSAVRAQNITNGATAIGTEAHGAWTLPSISLIEGTNLIKVWAVDGTGSGSIADAVTVLVVRDTAAPAPSLRAHVLSYADERELTLANASVPPAYVVPQTKNDVTAVGAFKAATRLGWTSPPSATVLETTNPDNIPFVQIQVPVSAQEAPIATATYSISDGVNTYGGDLVQWVSSSSTATANVYDLPLSANLVPSLATTTATALTLSISVTMTDAAGNSSGPISLPSVSFTIVGPPLYIAEDTSYPTYGDTRSTFPYKIAGASSGPYGAIFDTANTSFHGGQVRLVRYAVQNPSSQPVALASAVTGTWTMNETWTNFDAGVTHLFAGDGASYGEDGFTFVDRWLAYELPEYAYIAGDPRYPCDVTDQSPSPAAMHRIGDTATGTVCVSKQWMLGGGSVPGTATAAPTTATYQYQANAGEVATPATVSSMYVVPAALGTVPGVLTVYVARPVSAARSGLPLSWNSNTSSYEALHARAWVFESYVARTNPKNPMGSMLFFQAWRAHNAAGRLTAATESLPSSTISFTSRSIAGTELAGVARTINTFDVSRTIMSH